MTSSEDRKARRRIKRVVAGGTAHRVRRVDETSFAYVVKHANAVTEEVLERYKVTKNGRLRKCNNNE